MTLTQLGWNSIYETVWNGADRGSNFPARVIEVHRDAWRLLSPSVDSLAKISGRLRHRLLRSEDWPSVGDWVETNGDAILDILPRHIKLSRKAAGNRTDEQIVAANLDTMIVISSLDQALNPRRFGRDLTGIWVGDA